MILNIACVYTGWAAAFRDAKIGRKTWNERIKQLYAYLGRYWHSNYRERHFTRAGAREYGYTPRVGERGRMSGTRKFARTYTGKKLRAKGHTNPLVWSGDSMRMTAILDVRATSKAARVVIHAPTLNRRAKTSPIRMHEEMTRISRREADQMIRLADKWLTAALRAITGRKVVRPGRGGSGSGGGMSAAA